MRVLVTFAVEAEFAPWRKLRNLEVLTVGGTEIFRAQIGRAQVDFLVTGMGIANATKAADGVMDASYEICITAGFAGALSEKHAIGDVLVAEAVQQLGKSKTLQCGRNLVHAARADGAKQVRMFLTSDHVVCSVEEKTQLAPFADAVEMESFAILAVANKHKLSSVAIRVISDTRNRDMPARIDTMMDEKGRVKVGGIVRYIARSPLQLPALIRLGRESSTAAEALTHFLEAFIKKLSFHTHGWPPSELQEIAAR